MHHIQAKILIKLAYTDTARFSELQPEGIENKLFSYHLKQLIRDKLITKTDSGEYSLTTLGKQAGIRQLTAQKSPKAHSILFLCVREHPEGKWLLYRRLVHPLKDRIGFMHASPIAGEPVETTAAKELLLKTGLQAQFTVVGNGYFDMYEGDNLISYTHFTLLRAEAVSGSLQPHHERAEYFWQSDPDFSAPNMLPNMPTLVQHLHQNSPFFIQESFNLE